MNAAKPGSRWRSAVCDTEVVVIRSELDKVDLECGGVPMVAAEVATDLKSALLAPGFATGSVLGKRYVDVEERVEVLCVKPGAGSLAVGGVSLRIKNSRPLPASD
jgi:hypothetical protein